MGFLNIVGFKYNVGIAYVNIFNDGRFNSSVWVLPKFVLVYGFIMQVLYVMYIGTICILYHHVGIVMGIPNQNVNLRELCKYANLSNFPSIMGRPIFQTRTWCGHLGYTTKGKIKWTFNLLMFHMLTSQNSWKVNKGIKTPHGMECLQIFYKPNGYQAINCQKPP